MRSIFFIQQSLNTEGLPFLLSHKNTEYLKGKVLSAAASWLKFKKGWDSIKTDADWVSEEAAYRILEEQAGPCATRDRAIPMICSRCGTISGKILGQSQGRQQDCKS